LIRFRLVEDERRYIALRTELYVRLAQSGADVSAIADILRNLGKIESFSYAEGIRQGVIAMSAQTGDAVDTSALDVHHQLYGHADTPLHEVERMEGIAGYGVCEERPWEFAPLTLGEAKKYYAAPVPSARAEDCLEDLQEPSRGKTLAEIFSEEVAEDATDEHLHRVASPDFLDRVREELLNAQRTFESWSDLIYHLHRATGVDAGALDLQLSTAEGRAVLDQAGFFNLSPDETFDMARYFEESPVRIQQDEP